MAWVILIAAGLCEMVGVLMINQLHRSRSWKAYAGMIIGFGLSFWLLAMAMQSLSMGTAYAVWTGIGASGGALLGMLFYDEPPQTLRIICIALILAATIGLKFIG
ncbi:multidrug efflux SMR transporter [Halalkalibacterium halodurans]|uniref:DMT family transporter n=1 Tax=Halalkalibacterium halodurans TaxID=86665 RepID=UPI0010681C1A|nr:multidrug efflux SMR transporter [Halalkalibacterium halodurans]TES50050.1 multidrug efflux SMR transporter [Halalkalibacterium halodurans]